MPVRYVLTHVIYICMYIKGGAFYTIVKDQMMELQQVFIYIIGFYLGTFIVQA